MTEKPKPNKRRKRGRTILVGIVMLLACAVVVLFTLRVEGYAKSYGNVTACQDPLLRASQKGPIAEILVESDDLVHKGQRILQLDDNLARASLHRDQEALNEAMGRIEVFKAQCDLSQAHREYQHDYAQLQIQAAKHRLDQLLAGQAKGTVSSIEAAEAQLEYEIAALDPLETYKAQEQLEEQELALLEQQLEAARAQVELSEQLLANLRVLSPIDGRVVLNPLVVGEVVDANKILGRVFDETSFSIQARFPERLLYMVKTGQQVEVWPMGRSRWAEPLEGKVAKAGRLVQPQESGDGYFWVTISLDPHSVALYPGQDTRVSVAVGRVSLLRSILGL